MGSRTAVATGKAGREDKWTTGMIASNRYRKIMRGDRYELSESERAFRNRRMGFI